MKICLKCTKDLPIECFEKRPDRPSVRNICKSCRESGRDKSKQKERNKNYMRLRRTAQPDIVRQNWERSKYGMSKEDIGQTCCQICGRTDKLCIDHCHSTSKVRGLLCSQCNLGIGCLKDSVDLLQKAINYLNFNITNNYE